MSVTNWLKIAGGITLMALASPGWSTSWGYQPNVRAGAQYETNPNYRTDGFEDSATGTTINGRLDLFAETQRTRWTAQPNLNFSFFSKSDNENLDQTDYSLPVTGLFLTPRSQTGFSAQYSVNSTRNAEFEPAIPDDPDNPPPPGSGRTNNIDEDQTYRSVSPYVRYSLTPRNTLGLSTSYADTSYDREEITQQPGYENMSAAIDLQHSLNAKNFISISVNGTTFRSDQPCSIINNLADTCGVAFAPGQLGTDITNNTDSYGATISYQYSASSTQSLGITAGATQSDYTIENLRNFSGLPCYDPVRQSFVPCAIKGSEINFVGDLFYSIRSEQTTSTLSIGRALQPSSDGATVTQDNLRAFIIREISERLQVSAGVNAIKSEFVGGTQNGQLRERFDRKYWRISANARWSLTERWGILISYDYVDNNDQGRAVQSASNDTVRLLVDYRGLERRSLPW